MMSLRKFRGFPSRSGGFCEGERSLWLGKIQWRGIEHELVVRVRGWMLEIFVSQNGDSCYYFFLFLVKLAIMFVNSFLSFYSCITCMTGRELLAIDASLAIIWIRTRTSRTKVWKFNPRSKLEGCCYYGAQWYCQWTRSNMVGKVSHKTTKSHQRSTRADYVVTRYPDF